MEFAIIGSVAVTILLGVVELGLMLVMQVQVSNATLAVARSIRIGGLTAPGAAVTSSSGTLLDLADFKSKLCSYIQVVAQSTCVQQIQVDVRVQQAWSGATAPNPLTGTTFSNAGFCYYSGGPGDLVEFRTFYLWPLFEPVLLSPLVTVTSYSGAGSATGGNWIMLVSVETFRNEANPNVMNTGAGC